MKLEELRELVAKEYPYPLKAVSGDSAVDVCYRIMSERIKELEAELDELHRQTAKLIMNKHWGVGDKYELR